MKLLDLKNKNKKIIYWILSCTWGICTTFFGALFTLILMCFGYRPKKFGWDIYINIGKNWGGFSLGPFFFIDDADNYVTKCHEHGHGIQNIILGPLFIFVVGIKSVIRYWLFAIEEATDRQIFTTTLSGLLLLVSLFYFNLSIYLFDIINVVISFIICLYSIYLLIWLNYFELPKFEDNVTYPKYEDFWAEAQASKYGKILLDK